MAEHSPVPRSETTESLLKKLCFHIAENKQDVANHFYSIMREFLFMNQVDGKESSTASVVQRVSSNASLGSSLGTFASFKSESNGIEDEVFRSDQRRVKSYLSTVDGDAAKVFQQLCDKIQSDENILLHDRKASLTFLMNMAKKTDKKGEGILDQVHMTLPPFNLSSLSNNNKSTGHKGVGDYSSCEGSVEKLFPVSKQSSISSVTTVDSVSRSCISDLKSPSTIVNASYSRYSPSNKKPPDSGFQSWDARSRPPGIRSDDVDSAYCDIERSLTEWDLIQGIIFTWQGIEGNIFKMDMATHRYRIDDKISVDRTTREKAETLTLLGYLHNILCKYTEESSNSGMVRKCFITYVREQLSDFYALVANIQTQFQEEFNRERSRKNLRKSLVTMERLKLLFLHPTRIFQDLISVLEYCEHDKGGYLASTVYCFLQHGDPDLQSLVKGILSEICKPLYSMLTKWLLDGELSDPYREFFIAADNNISGDKLWHEKYTIRESMLPVFISVAQAEKILSVGKSINFLREICEDENSFSERDKMKDIFTSTSVDVMYLLEREDEMQQLIDLAYKHTNKRVMNVLVDKYSLLNHFQAHRKYLLLGQGDFIHHFMELLLEDLEKPAEQLHPHHLNGILESAIRATTAQFDDDNILKRLDADTMNHSQGDTGWDIFYLRYHVDGPIGTVFGLSRDSYQLLFYALWKAKRMEMVLSQLWKKQTTSAKMFRRIKELYPVLHQCNLLTSEMIHFIHQTQYYFLFEVLECCWNQLIDEVHHADSLDEVINAHQHFLKTVLGGVFKDEKHGELSNQLRIVYDLILQLRDQVDILLSQSQREVDERQIHEAEMEVEEVDVDRNKIEYLKRRRDFITRFVPSANANLKILAKTYHDTVKKFVLTLNSQDDLNLQLLSVRLDFNEHYKSLDSRLVAPLTFNHRRMSSLGGESLTSSPVLPRKMKPKSLESTDSLDLTK